MNQGKYRVGRFAGAVEVPGINPELPEVYFPEP
jgi:hypothetical protein